LSGRGGIAVVVGLVLLVAGLLFALLERRQMEVDVPAGREARNNPYLAAQRFLERQGVGVEVRRNPPQISQQVAFLPSTALLDATAAEGWIRFLEEGGYLIAGIGDDPIRRRLWTEELRLRLVAPPTQPEKVKVGDLHSEGAATLTIECQAAMSLDPAVEDVALAAYRAEGHVPVALLERGRGKLLLLADDQIFANDRIGNADHAAFLWYAVAADGAPVRLELVLRQHHPRPLYYLARAWPLWLALGVWLTTFLWSRGARFGPLREKSPPAQRGVRDHLRAAARFLWRQRTPEDLVAAARAAFERRAAAALPGWAQLAPEERAAALQSAVRPPGRLASAAIESALHGPAPRTPAAFLHLIAKLETLRRSL
jgi:hypothetical protein